MYCPKRERLDPSFVCALQVAQKPGDEMDFGWSFVGIQVLRFGVDPRFCVPFLV